MTIEVVVNSAKRNHSEVPNLFGLLLLLFILLVDKFVVNSKIAKALAKRNIFTLLSVGSFVKMTAIGVQIGRP